MSRGDEIAPSKPGDVQCEWCGNKATKAHGIPRRGRKGLPTGTYIYTCPRHHEQALAVIEAKLPKKRGAQ